MMNVMREINKEIDSHFSSNHGRHHCFGIDNSVSGGVVQMEIVDFSRIRMSDVAAFILKKHPEIFFVTYPGFVFTRHTLEQEGYRFKNVDNADKK